MSQRPAGVSSRADFVAALAWMVFGLAIAVASWRMDRLEQFGASLYTAPGLVPGVLGALITLLAIVLLVRSVRRGAVPLLAAPWAPTPEGRATLVRALVATALALAYSLGVVGHLPFAPGTALFVFVFILVFDLPERRARGETLRGIVVAAVTAIATATVVTLVFERVFLVRLP